MVNPCIFCLAKRCDLTTRQRRVEWEEWEVSGKPQTAGCQPCRDERQEQQCTVYPGYIPVQFCLFIEGWLLVGVSPSITIQQLSNKIKMQWISQLHHIHRVDIRILLFCQLEYISGLQIRSFMSPARDFRSSNHNSAFWCGRCGQGWASPNFEYLLAAPLSIYTYIRWRAALITYLGTRTVVCWRKLQGSIYYDFTTSGQATWVSSSFLYYSLNFWPNTCFHCLQTLSVRLLTGFC